MKTILAFDQGTTGVTVVLVAENLEVIAESAVDFPQHFPQAGWVEHDLDQIWAATLTALKSTLALASKKIPQPEKTIAAIGITNQRETICFWDKKTAKPLARAIVWQDRRTSEFCAELKAKGLESKYQKATGLFLDPYFSGTKVAWALKNWSVVAQAAKKNSLAIGTIDSFVMAKLSAGQGSPAHVTDPSNASRTLCFDIQKLEFEDSLCEPLGVPCELWPEVKSSASEFTRTSGVPGLPDGIPITGVLGDQQAALLGQACVKEGMAKCTYGTGAFLLMNTGTEIARSRHRLLSTVAWKFGSQPACYALEGSAFIAGAAVQWLRDALGWIHTAQEIEALASSVPSTDGVVFVPALVGLGAPYWDADARGAFLGLTRGSTKAHLARAVLEGIAFQNVDILEAMQKDLGKPMLGLNVDGGASANNLLMQFQADVLGVPLTRPKNLETTSMGAVFAAGLGAGLWSSPDDVAKAWKRDRIFEPQISKSDRDEILVKWRSAVKRVSTNG